MRRRLPDVPSPAEMPSRLRCFDPDEWSEGDGEYAARDRWAAAGYEWGAQYGLSPLDIIKRRRQDRRAAAGLPPAPE